MEAIKKAVEVGLGAAFVSRAAVQKELQLGLLAAVELEVTGLPPARPAAPRQALKTVQAVQAVLPRVSQGAVESVLQTGKMPNCFAGREAEPAAGVRDGPRAVLQPRSPRLHQRAVRDNAEDLGDRLLPAASHSEHEVPHVQPCAPVL